MSGLVFVKSATPDDVDIVFGMHKEIFRAEIEERWGWDDDWQKNKFLQEWGRDFFELIYDGGNVIGYIQKKTQPDHLYLRSFGLIEEYRGKGLGVELMKRLLVEISKDFQEIRLSVAHFNHAAINLYKKMGFDVLSESDDGMIMGKCLNR